MTAPAAALPTYLKKLTHLRQGVTKYGKAPHKPILLLTFIELFEKGEITANKVYISPELVALFKEIFALLVKTAHKADFFFPFYHLSGEGFWTIRTRLGVPLQVYIGNFNKLHEAVDYGCFSEELYALLHRKEHRDVLKTALLDRYFPDTKNSYLAIKQGSYIQNLQRYLLNESTASYALPESAANEEELFIRGGLFKKLVPQVYNHTCCMSGMRLVSSHGYSMIDACHIVPFSLSKDDKVNNGLALCPNLHRAFDRGLVSVSEKLRILVSDAIAEDLTNAYALLHLRGKTLTLPFGEKHFPSAANLAWHREQVFKGIGPMNYIFALFLKFCGKRSLMFLWLMDMMFCRVCFSHW
ncbi:HNH endonuclease [Pontibacter sp. SGAir0037]|uniref:HNH endonuclease n=1 Tax=Pontibacter sp. SGAir0037 TaxID=2571030 RepID=UPI0010CCC898|nr:HNH endonuclease [Pontibacter sp. SGAir0037]QCR22339.1 restriction endonuclease [Pontibacter sp. SGAir0037]